MAKVIIVEQHIAHTAQSRKHWKLTAPREVISSCANAGEMLTAVGTASLASCSDANEFDSSTGGTFNLKFNKKHATDAFFVNYVPFFKLYIFLRLYSTFRNRTHQLE